MTAKVPSPLPSRSGLSAWLIALLAMLIAPLLHAQQVVQFQGIASIIGVNGLPSPGTLSTPAGITVDTEGNVYVTDSAHNRVVVTSPNGASSTVLSISGLSLNRPYGIAADSTGDIYIADTLNNRIVEVSGGTVSVVSMSGLAPGLSQPHGVAADAYGDIYVADTGNNRIVEIPAGGGAMSLPTGGLTLNAPYGVAVDGAGNIYITDTGNNRIVELDGAGNASVLATNGITVSHPSSLAVDAAGDLYIADTSNNRLVEVTTAGNAYALPVGSPGGVALNQPVGVALDATGNVYIADTGNDRLVQMQEQGLNFGTQVIGQSTQLNLPYIVTGSVTLGTPRVVTQGATGLDFQSGSGGTCAAQSYNPGQVCTVNVIFKPVAPGLRAGAVQMVDSSGNVQSTIYVRGNGQTSQTVAPQAAPTVLSVNGISPAGLADPAAVAADSSGNVYIADTDNDRAIELAANGQASVLANVNSLESATGIAVDGAGNVYIADADDGRVIEVSGGVASILNVGDPGGSLDDPNGLAVDGAGNLYIADGYDNRVVEVTAAGNASELNTGTPGGIGLNDPLAVAVDAKGNILIADEGNDRIVQISPSGAASVLNTGSVTLNAPQAVALDGLGNAYIADTSDNQIIEVSASGNASILNTGTPGGLPLNLPEGIAADGWGNIYIADTFNGRILKMASPGGNGSPGKQSIPSIALQASAASISVGQSVTLTVAVSATAVGQSTPTGTVKFYNGGTQISSAGLNSSGVASVTVTGASLNPGANTFTAVYSGDTHYLGATSTSVTVQLTASTPGVLTWTPAATQEVYGTPLGAGVLNAAIPAGETGTISYSAKAASGTSQAVTAATILAAGSFSLTATFTPSNSSLQSLTKTITFTVTPAPLALTASNATRAYYASNPVFTGKISGAANGDSFTESFSTTAQQTSGAGTYPIIPTAAGTALANYTVTVTDGTLTITKVSSQLTLSASATAVVAGASVTLTATATSTTPGMPSGTVTFTTGSTQLGQSTLNAQGTATLSITNLPVGSDTVSANYQGDTNFVSSQAQLGITVTAAGSTLTWTPSATQEVYGNPLGAGMLNAGTPAGETGTISYSAQAAGGASQPVTADSILPAGSFTLTATFTPTNSSLAPLTKMITFTVTPAPLTLTAGNSTRPYYASNPLFTGTISGAVNGDSFSESFSTTAQQSSNAGSYPIIPSATGAGLANYTVAVTDGTFTISQASSQLSLSASVNTVAAGTPVTLTALATSNTPGMPTGTITFVSGGAELGQSPLNAHGVATLTIANLAVGTDTIAATYQGDTNFTGSGAQIGVNVTTSGGGSTGTSTGGSGTGNSPGSGTGNSPGSAPGTGAPGNGNPGSGDPGAPATPKLFHIQSNAANLTVQPGQAGTATLTLTPIGGYAGAVSFTCLNLPVHTACSFGPTGVTFDGSAKPAHATLTIATSVIEQSRSGQAQLKPLLPKSGGDPLPLLPAVIFWCPGAMLAFGSSKNKLHKKRGGRARSNRLAMLAIFAIVAASLGGMIGCANLSPFTTPASQQTITVVAAGTGNISQSVQIQLIVP